MATIATIPLRTDVFNYQFSVTLSGVLYNFTLRYNGRMDRWILNIDDAAGNQVMSGIPLLLNVNLLKQYPTLNVMEGSLMAIDISGKFIQPSQFSFGDNNFLVYFT